MENEERHKLFANLAVDGDKNEDLLERIKKEHKQFEEEQKSKTEETKKREALQWISELVDDGLNHIKMPHRTYHNHDDLVLFFLTLKFNEIETQIKSLDEKLDEMQERLENNNEKLDRIMFWLEDADKHKIYANKCIIKQK